VSTLVNAGSVGSAAAPLPFRLRTLLGVLLVGCSAATVLPRMRAAWRLHGLVSRVADYGLCMAGPTGAVAIRDDVSRFRLLVRRRLVASEATSMPFARCAALASEISGRPELMLGHAQMAAEFIEWGGGGQKHSINELLRVLPELATLHAQSWPLARKPLAELVRPSRGAFEAVHPMDPPRPSPVVGLAMDGAVLRSTVETTRGRFVVLSNERDVWAFRSRDNGRNWAATSAWQSALDGHAHHCVADATGTRFALAPARAGAPPALLLGSMTAIGTERREFGAPSDVVVRVACDESGAVTLIEHKGAANYQIFTCPIGSHCREVTLPPEARQRDVLLDVARVARTVVIALAKDGLVRVTTSRDEGVTMTPLSLVFDARDSNLPNPELRLAPALIGFDKQLQLTLSAPSGPARFTLWSDDYGASFHSL
jgi:hypothetical protein